MTVLVSFSRQSHTGVLQLLEPFFLLVLGLKKKAPKRMVLKIDRRVGGSFFFLSSPLERPAIRLEGLLLLTPSLVGLLLQYTRGAFDLSPKAEPDQMERPGRAFDLAVLPVLSDPEPLEQCSNGSAP